MTVIKVFILFVLLIPLSVFGGKPFIVDTDMGIDDAIALLYLLQRPDVDIKAITISCNASAHCVPGYRNIQGLLQLTNKNNIPVAGGRTLPLAGNHRFTQAVLDESDTLGGTANLLKKSSQALPQQTAVELLIQTLNASQTPLNILAIGSLTNIAEALERYPAIRKKINKIYFMGGAIHVPGNIQEVDATSKNRFAEWNVFIDPTAAEVVFSNNPALVIVPLDVTNQLPIDMEFYQRLAKNHAAPAANFVYHLLQKNLPLIKTNQWYFWDPLTAVIATDESLATFKQQPLRVVLTPEDESGRLVVDAQHSEVIVVTAVNGQRFKELLVEYLQKR